MAFHFAIQGALRRLAPRQGSLRMHGLAGLVEGDDDVSYLVDEIADQEETKAGHSEGVARLGRPPADAVENMLTEVRSDWYRAIKRSMVEYDLKSTDTRNHHSLQVQLVEATRYYPVSYCLVFHFYCAPRLIHLPCRGLEKVFSLVEFAPTLLIVPVWPWFAAFTRLRRFLRSFGSSGGRRAAITTIAP